MITIAIDGPVGAGKSTLSAAVAQKLDILHLDTGAMYRAVGLAALQNGIDPGNEHEVNVLCEANKAQVDVLYQGKQQITLLNGQDVSSLIRTEEVGIAASTVSRYKGVRHYLVSLQRQLAKTTDILMDGRDIGTVVLPDAKVKIFLTASAEARARRRFLQLQKAGGAPRFEQVLADLIERDRQDETRELDPLRKADDAVLLDTSALTFDQSVQAVLRIVEAAYGK